MRKPFVSLLVGVFVVMALALPPGRSPGIVRATVDLTGWWGYVYAMGATTYGECTVELSQDGSGNLTSPTEKVQCTHAKDGDLTATVNANDTVTDGKVHFAQPAAWVYFDGDVLADGSQQGNWGTVPGNLPNTYKASRLEDTPVDSPSAVEVQSGGWTFDFRFAQVDPPAGGTAVVSDSSAWSPLPGEYKVLDALFFHVITTANYSKTGDLDSNGMPIELCVRYLDHSGDQPKIAHYENGDWQDLLPNLHTNYNQPPPADIPKVCSYVDSLSEFALVVPSAGPVGGIADLPDTAGDSGQEAGVPPDNSNWSAGGDVALAGGLAAVAIAIVGGWYARRRWLR